jgi:hypothetical protein
MNTSFANIDIQTSINQSIKWKLKKNIINGKMDGNEEAI